MDQLQSNVGSAQQTRRRRGCVWPILPILPEVLEPERLESISPV
ncbi:MAG: hypothetical protein SGJ20_17670 [Planctomycetota bacterium]|nr:hypothetical protein [Planctomycetota bacterium]